MTIGTSTWLERGRERLLRPEIIINNFLLVALVALWVYFAIKSPVFATWGNHKIILANNATLGVVIDRQKVVDLPLNGRNFTQLGTLIPGVVAPPSGLGGQDGNATPGGYGPADLKSAYNVPGNGTTTIARIPFVELLSPAICPTSETPIRSPGCFALAKKWRRLAALDFSSQAKAVTLLRYS